MSASSPYLYRGENGGLLPLPMLHRIRRIANISSHLLACALARDGAVIDKIMASVSISSGEYGLVE